MYSLIGMAAQAAADEGLTLQEVVESVPLDPLSILAMVLMAVAFGAVVYFGVRSNAPDPVAPGETAPVAREKSAPVPPEELVSPPSRPVARADEVSVGALVGRGGPGG